jgi:signal recognition particle receptor subunit beta
LPIFFTASNWSFRVKVYTVPGQPIHEATRRIVLKSVDGVAFVADSQASQRSANDESYQNLRKNMEMLGLQRGKVPIIIQYNKRDLPDIIPEPELVPYARIPKPEPVFAASAITGEGVVETFYGLCEHTWDAVDRNLNIKRSVGIDRDTFMQEVRKHITLG